MYTREKDDLMSFVCHGKEADIEDADYQDVYELKPKLPENKLLYELMLDINNVLITCFVHIKEDLLLIATEKGDFQLLKPNKDQWDFIRCPLKPKFNGNDMELYKMGVKTLIDMCLDSKGNLITLNRWKFKKDESNIEQESSSENQFTHKYTIELFSFNTKATDAISYLKTLCCLSNEKASVTAASSVNISLSPKNMSNITTLNNTNNSNLNNLNKTIEKMEKSPVFTRVYNDEKNSSVVLIDSSNSKIYWFKKSTGAKRRCLKSQDNSLKDPKSIAFSYDEKEAETIYICSKGGLVASNKNFTIKHDTLVTLEDIYFDSYVKCLLFIDSRNLYGGRISQKQSFDDEDKNKKQENLINESKEFNVEGQNTSEEAPDCQTSVNTDLRYKRLFTYTITSSPNFTRLISTKNYVFILSDRKDTLKSSVFAIDKHKLQSNN